MNSTAIDFSRLNISHEDLQAYLDAEREAQERAAHAAKRAELDRLLEEREALIAATRKADAAARDAGDPSYQAATLLMEILGERRKEFIAAFTKATAPKFAAAVARLHREIESQAQHASLMTAGQDRLAAEQAVVAARKVRVDGELTRLGIRDVTPDEDEA